MPRFHDTSVTISIRHAHGRGSLACLRTQREGYVPRTLPAMSLGVRLDKVDQSEFVAKRFKASL